MPAKYRFFLGSISVAVIGMVLLAYATSAGPGLSPDSRAYLQAARFILQGKGICNINGNGDVVPLTHFAPLYPILLAAFGAGADPLDRARALGIVVFGLNIVLGGCIVFRQTGKSALAGIIGSIIVAVSFDLLRVHAMAWSEPAFITFMLAGFLLTATYLNTLKMRWLIAGACALAAAFLMRYSGASILLAVGLIVLLWPGRRIRKRVIDSIIFGVISVLPMVIWILRNKLKAHDATDRTIAFHPPNWHDIQVSLITFVSWFVPVEVKTLNVAIVIGAITILAIVLGALLAWRHETAKQSDVPLQALLPIFAVVYLGFLLFSVSFVDAHTPLDYRILSPLYITLVLWVASLALRWIFHDKNPLGARMMMAILLAGFIGSHIGRSAIWARATSKEGIGFGAKVWRDSPTLAWIKALPPNTLLYSNAPDLIDFRTSRFAKPVPKLMDPITRKPEKTYVPYLKGLRDDLTARGGYIVWFKTRSASRWYLVTEKQLKKDLSLQAAQTFADGNVYQLQK
jgi:4-amino-4-deoxy-L-arabinose transferase-like glycosyltransferase